MFDFSGVVKFIDFRSSVCMERNYKMVSCGKKPGCFDDPLNKLRYIAPEVLKGMPYNEKADIYSAGVILWQLLTGKVPFSKQTSTKSFFSDVVSGGFRPKLSKIRDPVLAKLVESCWSADHRLRPTAREILSSWKH